jgi:hypothetical protein
MAGKRQTAESFDGLAQPLDEDGGCCRCVSRDECTNSCRSTRACRVQTILLGIPVLEFGHELLMFRHISGVSLSNP